MQLTTVRQVSHVPLPRVIYRHVRRRVLLAALAVTLVVAGTITAVGLQARQQEAPAALPSAGFVGHGMSAAHRWAGDAVGALVAAPATTPPTEPPVYGDFLTWAANTQENVSLDGYAAAFMSYFLQLYPYVQNTGDLTDWEAHSGPDCEFCRSVADGVATDQAAGLSREHGPIEVTYSRAMSDSDGVYYVAQLLTEQPYVVRDAEGVEIETAQRRRSLVISRVMREDGTWRVLGVAVFATLELLPESGEALARDVPQSPGDPTDPTFAGAAVLAVQYALLHAHALAAGDVEPLQAATDSRCQRCADLIAAAAAFPASQRPGDGAVTLDGIWFWEVGGALPAYGFQVGLVIDDGDSAPVSWIYFIELHYEGGRWYVNHASGKGHPERLARTEPATE